MNWLHYLVEANIYLSVFYLFYCVFLIKETHYTLNRAYLLMSSIVAFILPLVQVGMLKPVTNAVQQVAVLPGNVVYSTVIPAPITVKAPAFTYQDALVYIYLVGVVIVFALLAMKLYKLFRLGNAQKKENLDGYKLVNLESSNTAFSFFNYLFIGDAAPGRAVIIRHELVHIRQKHSADIILIELLKIINWFNPFIYLLQNSLKTVHEYIADDLTAREEQDKLAYSTFLVNNAYGISGLPVTHSFFNYNLLKKRIMMLHQQRSGKLARLKYLLAIPLCMALLTTSTLSFSKNYGWITVLPAKKPALKLNENSSTNKKLCFYIKPTDNDHQLAGIGIKLYKEGYLMDFEKYRDKDGQPLISISLKTLQRLSWHSQVSATFRVNELVKIGYNIEVGANEKQQQLFVRSVEINHKDQSVKFPPPVVLKDSYAGLMHYFETKAVYPKDALGKGMAGLVLVRFKLNSDHTITDLGIIKSGGAAFDAEVLRILKAFNNPIDDKPGFYTLLVSFNLSNDVRHVLPPAPDDKQGTYAGEIMVIGRLGNRAITPPPPPTAPAAQQQVKFPKPKPHVDQLRFPPPVVKPNAKVDTTVSKEFEKLYNTMGKTVRYPKAARDNGIVGKVFACFTVDDDHNIKTVSVLRAPSDDLATEVMRALRVASPVIAAKPGINYIIPVNFIVNGYQGLTPPPAANLKAKGDDMISTNTNVALNEVVVISYISAGK